MQKQVRGLQQTQTQHLISSTGFVSDLQRAMKSATDRSKKKNTWEEAGYRFSRDCLLEDFHRLHTADDTVRETG